MRRTVTRPARSSRWLRPSFVAVVLALSSAALVAPPVVSVAAAKRKKKKKKKKGASPGRTIKKEGSLSPKRAIELDEEITKTKDVKAKVDDEAGRGLSLSDLTQDATEQLLDKKIQEEIDNTKELLKFERDCEGRSQANARLADLYWVKSKRVFFLANDFNTSAADRKKYGKLMKALQERTVEHYRTVVEQCEDYSDFPKILYNLGKTLVELNRAKEGAQYFKRIIKEHGANDEWVSQAWFMVGEYYFNDEGNARQAFKAYKRAAEYHDSTIYGFAIYKQGWCHINDGDWDMALAAFREVITIAEDPRISTSLGANGAKSLKKGALKDYVRAYSNVGDALAAYRDFLGIGGKDNIAWMMENLGNWYSSRDAHADVIAVYRDLIKHFKRSTRKPIFQGRIVNAADKLGDEVNTVKQVKLLTKYFGEVRKMQQKAPAAHKEKIGKDLKEAEDIAENTMRRLALEHHKDAKKLPEGSKAAARSYKYAYELYKHYLDVFPKPNPKATVNYVFFMRYYYAEVLFQREEFLEAAKNYDMVVDMNPHPEKKREKQIVLGAAEDSVRAYDELVADMDRKNPPDVGGDEPKPIPEIKQDLIRSCMRYIEYVGSVGDKIVEIRYKMARIYYTYNHFDKAAPAFNDIVENHPGHDVACYAANLALDIHNYAKNYVALRRLTRSYLRNKELESSCERNSSGNDFAKFAQIEEQASFLLIKNELELKKKYIECGNKYMDFYRQYGAKSKYAIDSVYNSTVCYDKGQRLEKANEVREFLVKTFAKNNVKEENPLVIETMHNIALSYERVVDFRKAAEYLERFVAKYPNDKRSKDALYNIGVYLLTLRDFNAGRAARQEFLSKYPADEDDDKIKWAICESYELEAKLAEDKKDKGAVKKWEAAHDCYEDWTKQYGKVDTDLLCHAQFRRGEIMRDKTKYAKGYAEQRKYLLKNWPKWEKKEGKEKLPRCATAVSEIMFRDIAPEHRAFAGLRFADFYPLEKGKGKKAVYDPKKGQKAFYDSVTAKGKARDALVEHYKEIAKIGVPEWSLASLYEIGEAQRNILDRIEAVKKTKLPEKVKGVGKMTAEDKATLKQMMQQKLDEDLKNLVAPVADLAVDAYRICVDTANRLGVYNKWSIKALAQLQKLRPDEFPPLVERLPEVKFSDKLAVVENGVVLRDTKGFKDLEQPLEDGVGPPKAAKQKPAGAPGEGDDAGGKGTKKGKKKKKKKKKRGDEIPAPVTSRFPDMGTGARARRAG